MTSFPELNSPEINKLQHIIQNLKNIANLIPSKEVLSISSSNEHFIILENKDGKKFVRLTKKGEDQELTHTVSTFCSQRVWVKIGWKEWVRLQCNSTCCPQDVARILPRTLFTARIPIFFGFTPRCTMRYFHEKE